MTIFNYLIRHIEGTLASPASIQNKQWKIDVGDDGSGGDESEIICQDQSGTQHVYETRAQSRAWVTQQITNNTGLATSEGTYTPTDSSASNLSSITVSTFEWFRVGSYVTIFGNISATIDVEGTTTLLELDLPVTSNFANSRDAVGYCNAIITSGINNDFQIIAETTNNTLKITGEADSSGSKTFNVKATYKVI